MKSNFTLIGATLFAALMMNFQSAMAQLPTPMSCQSEAFIAQGVGSDWSTFDLSTGSSTVASDTFASNINAIGYNVKDNRIWGYGGYDDGRLTITSNAGGTWNTVTTTNPIPGLPLGGYITGDADTSGFLYIHAGGTGPTKFYAVNIDPSSPNYLTLREATGVNINFGRPVFDWAFNPRDGFLYAVGAGTTSQVKPLYQINRFNGTITNLGSSGIPNGEIQGYGAAFFDSDGYLYVYNNNSGNIYRIDLTGGGGAFDPLNTSLFAATGVSLQYNDGARCPLASLPIDFGDAPDTYGTQLASNGARHGLRLYSGSTANLYLGTSVASETNGQPSNNASASTDDDGVSSVPVIVNSGVNGETVSTYSLTVAMVNNSGSTAYLGAWIDWNGNGTFEASEGVLASRAGTTTSGSVTFTWTNMYLSTLGNKSGTFARIRISNTAITTSDFVGSLSSGEVEDYAVPYTVPLPVVIKSFDAKLDANTVKLSWTTADEQNISNYDIEESYDGKNFTKIGETHALNIANQENSYSFNHDLKTLASNLYYRILAKDFDGCKTAYSIVRKVSNIKSGTQHNVKVFPNPSTGTINVVMSQGYNADLDISNVLGQTLKTQKLNSANTQLNLDAYEKGVYFLRLSFEDGTSQTIKIIKE